MKRKIRAAAAILLMLCLLTACGQAAEPQSSAAPTPTPGVLPGTELGVRDTADDVFSLNYNSSDRKSVV